MKKPPVIIIHIGTKILIIIILKSKQSFSKVFNASIYVFINFIQENMGVKICVKENALLLFQLNITCKKIILLILLEDFVYYLDQSGLTG